MTYTAYKDIFRHLNVTDRQTEKKKKKSTNKKILFKQVLHPAKNYSFLFL